LAFLDFGFTFLDFGFTFLEFDLTFLDFSFTFLDLGFDLDLEFTFLEFTFLIPRNLFFEIPFFFINAFSITLPFKIPQKYAVALLQAARCDYIRLGPGLKNNC
jgi:hypothetical protein